MTKPMTKKQLKDFSLEHNLINRLPKKTSATKLQALLSEMFPQQLSTLEAEKLSCLLEPVLQQRKP